MRKFAIIFAIYTGIIVSHQPVSGQNLKQDSIFFTGAVMDQNDLTPLPYTHFQINYNRAGTTNEYGRFFFWANIGDTVQYSFVGYKSIRLIISDSLVDNSYLFGVFLTKDTITLNEVLILPRFGDFKQAFINAKINTPDYVHAKNNVSSATYKALTSAPKKMDAKANTDLVIKSYQTKVEYKGLIPPDMVVGVSLMQTLPEIQRIKRKQKMKIQDNLVTDMEINALKSIYRAEIEK